ncbi:MAG TPA: UTP--glucose-1-phosphate uridylyltransferase GalU [Gammaproteobacteria bacterium]|nr:UTP--glucose-1-phosphate uridylyltransferase GalU [Gammaproteobacteria bacterium]
MTQQKIRKAVFPVAGMGTRFLPATKANPKEMLPIVDKPLIQYAVEEAVAAGMTQMIFINGRNKHAIPNHFDKAYELEVELESRGKHELLKMVQGIVPDNVTCIYIRQAEPLGLGHAVLCAQPVVGNEPFAVILADDLIDGENDPCLSQMTRLYDELESSILGVQEVGSQDTDKYGIVDSEAVDETLSKVNAIVEKPKPAEAPSTLGVVGRYILTPGIFDQLERTERGSGGEIQLTDAIHALLAQEDVYAYAFEGTRYDCGNKLGYLQATVEFAMKHPELSEDFCNYLHSVSLRK